MTPAAEVEVSPYRDAELLWKKLEALGETRHTLDAARAQVEVDIGAALLEVGRTPRLSIADAAKLLGLSRATAYRILEDARRRKSKPRRR
jgi:CRP-like cAMP-binding protein